MDSKWYNDFLRDVECPSEILQGQRNGFLFSLMVLSSYAIQADGKIMHSEMELVRNFLTEHFGEEKKQYCESVLMMLFSESKKHTMDVWSAKIERCTRQLTEQTTPQQRLLLLAFLIRIVKADNLVQSEEIASINTVASWLDISVEAAERIEDLKREECPSWNI